MQSSAGVSVCVRACVCVLCGLPAVGKSTLTHLLSHHLHTLGWSTFIISYDELIPEEAFHFITPERDDDDDDESSKEVKAETGDSFHTHRTSVYMYILNLFIISGASVVQHHWERAVTIETFIIPH